MAMAMTQHVVIESPKMDRRQPLLSGKAATAKDEKDGRNGRRIGEFAGGTTAECAAVCCCCPCAMIHLLILAVYKVPTGLCKKAWRKNKRNRLLKRKKKKKNFLEENKSGPNGINHDDESSNGDDDDDHDHDHKGVGVMDAVDLDSEMWDRFYGAGFWRSFSQRED